MKRIAASTLVLGLLCLPPEPMAAPTFAQDEIIIETKTDAIPITVELAETPMQHEYGLSHRESLAKDRGMLFLLKTDQRIGMWMKDTPIPLDMLFVDKRGVIYFIYENAEPDSTRLISSGKPSRAILELAGGATKTHGIAVGDRIIYNRFEP